MSGAAVVKLGGEVIASAELPVIAADLAALSRDRAVFVVHGGGPQATKLQEKLGQTPVKIAGRRVTIINTHLRPPHASQRYVGLLRRRIYDGMDSARRDGDLAFLLDFIGPPQPGETQIVLGDFNLGEVEPPYAHLRRHWDDAFRAAVSDWTATAWTEAHTDHSPALPGWARSVRSRGARLRQVSAVG